MSYLTEFPDRWSRLWLLMWAVVVVALVASAFFLPFGRWVLAATLAFGLPELFALAKKGDAYPPLTHVLRYFLPKWLTFASVYGVVGTLVAYWSGAKHSVRWGVISGLVGWLTAHFDNVYDE